MLKALLANGQINCPVINSGDDFEDQHLVVFDVLHPDLDEVFAICFLQCGAIPNSCNFSFTPNSKHYITFLHRAIELKHLNLVKLLVGKGANVNFPHIFMKDERLEIEEEIRVLKEKIGSKNKNKSEKDKVSEMEEDYEESQEYLDYLEGTKEDAGKIVELESPL